MVRSWEIVTIGSPGGIAVATKPGVFAHGRVDSAALLLATHVRVEQDDIAVVMGSGNGFVPAALARSGRSRRIVCTDRNILSVEATTRSLASNNAVNTEVVAQHGALGVVGDSSADTVAIRVPHEKIAFVQLLFDAFRVLKHGGTCYVAGATNEGIKSAGRLLERAFGNVVLIAYEGGSRILSATKNSSAPLDDTVFESPFASFDSFRELNVTLRGHDLKLFSKARRFFMGSSRRGHRGSCRSNRDSIRGIDPRYWLRKRASRNRRLDVERRRSSRHGRFRCRSSALGTKIGEGRRHRRLPCAAK